MTGARRRLTGRIRVALPPGEAFRLFTPRGEEDWAHGWHPRFPAPAPDDTEPGTVFETSAHGQHTIWLVTGREAGRRISYARVTPGDRAGTVTVTVSAAGQQVADQDVGGQHSGGQQAGGQHSEVEVSYELTALASVADRDLAEFAEGYPAYLRSWEDAIAALLRTAGNGADTEAGHRDHRREAAGGQGSSAYGLARIAPFAEIDSAMIANRSMIMKGL